MHLFSPKPIQCCSNGPVEELHCPTATISSIDYGVQYWAHGDKFATSSFFEYFRSGLHASCSDFKHNNRRIIGGKSGRQAVPSDFAGQSERPLHQSVEGLCGGWRPLSLRNHALFSRAGYLRHLRQFVERKDAGGCGRKGDGKLREDPRQLQGQDQHRRQLRDRGFEVSRARLSGRKAALLSPAACRPCHDGGGRHYGASVDARPERRIRRANPGRDVRRVWDARSPMAAVPNPSGRSSPMASPVTDARISRLPHGSARTRVQETVRWIGCGSCWMSLLTPQSGAIHLSV